MPQHKLESLRDARSACGGWTPARTQTEVRFRPYLLARQLVVVRATDVLLHGGNEMIDGVVAGDVKRDSARTRSLPAGSEGRPGEVHDDARLVADHPGIVARPTT